MLRKYNGGFVFLESIASLSIWLLLILGLFPQFIHLEMERHDVKLADNAVKILQEQLYEYIYDRSFKSVEIKTVDHKDYLITWEGIDESMIKICVSWKNGRNQTNEKCGYGKR